MEKTPFAKIDQVGVVVRDMDKAIKHYESMGIGPFKPQKKLVFTKRVIYGKPVVPIDKVKNKIMVAQMGPVQIELIQPVEGESHWKRFLDTKGEGIQHLGFFCDNIDREEAKIVKRGFNIIYSSRYDDGGGVCYFEPGVGDIILELIDLKP